MLEQLKCEVRDAYRTLTRYDLDRYARGMVSAIDRQSGRIVMQSAKSSLVADLRGNVIEGDSIPSADIQAHLAVYHAFDVGAVVHPHARYATIFAQVGMGIPVLGAFHKDFFRAEIPCADSASDMEAVFEKESLDPLRTPGALVLSEGAYAWGVTVLDAVENAAVLEETANMAYHTMQLDPGLHSII